jgi:hypothetical protein
MGKKRELVMRLYSSRRLDEKFARSQLDALIHFAGGIFLPERCDVYEPLREKFDPMQLEDPVRWLTTPGGDFKFRRTRPVGIFGFLENNLFGPAWVRDTKKGPRQELKPTVPEPIFCTRWVVWINTTAALKRGSGFLEEFLVTLFRSSECDYGFLTPQPDYDRKNYLISEDSLGTSMKYIGDDPEKGIPGLYWMNLFGPLYVNWFGKERFDELPCTTKEFLQGGLAFIQFGKSPDAWPSAEVAAHQRKAIEILGERAFFDISRPDRALVTPFGKPAGVSRPTTSVSHIQ